jgi:hypothetical protein
LLIAKRCRLDGILANDTHQTLFRVAEMAEQLGIEGDKALQLLIEYERQQAIAKGKK